MAKRNDKGHFVKGTTPGPGRPPLPNKRDYLNVIKSEVSIDDWRKVVLQAKADAIAGDKYARQFLAEYLIGKPPQILELKAGEAAQLREVINIMSNRFGVSPEEWIEDMYLTAQELQNEHHQLQEATDDA